MTTGLWSSQANAPRELFALDATGANLTQLTFCNAVSSCDYIEPVPSPDRNRMMLRQATPGTDGEALVFVDLAAVGRRRSSSPPTARVSGADWSPQDGVIVYSGLGEGNLEDLFRVDPNGQNSANLTQSSVVRERRPRIDPGAVSPCYERIETGAKGSIFIFQTSTTQNRVTSGGPGDGRPAEHPRDGRQRHRPRVLARRALHRLSPAHLRRQYDRDLGHHDRAARRDRASPPSPRARSTAGRPTGARSGILFTEVDVAARRDPARGGAIRTARAAGCS